MNFKQYLRKVLLNNDIDTIFSLPAYYIIELCTYLKDSGLNIIDFRSEFSAAFAADGYSRSSDKLGCAIINTGPSIYNCMTAIKTAQKDNIPMVILVGVQEDVYNNENFFQAVNIPEDVSKCTFDLNEKNLFFLDDMIKMARKDPMGPVIIRIPTNLYELNINNPPPLDSPYIYNSMFEKKQERKGSLDSIHFHLQRSNNPLIVIGNGASSVSTVKDLKLPFVTTFFARHFNHSEYCLGSIGTHGDDLANHALKQCDLLIGIGFRFSERSIADFSLLQTKTIIVCNIDEKLICEFNNSETVHIIADAKEIIDYLNSLGTQNKWWLPSPNDQSDQLKETHRVDYSKFTISSVVSTIYEKFPSAIFACDDGTYTLAAIKLYKPLAANKFLFSGSMAVGGQSIGAAIGATFSNPSEKIITIVGDGGILSVLGELHTVATYNIPILVLLFNNRGYESIRIWNSQYNDYFESIDFTSISTGLGVECKKIVSLQEFNEMLNQYDFSYPLVLDLCINKESFNCHFSLEAYQI